MRKVIYPKTNIIKQTKKQKMSFRCTECDMTFVDKSKRSQHYKSKHQSRVDVVFPGGRKHCINRSNDGTFTCLCERATYNNPRSLLKHCRFCSNIPHVNVNVNANTNANVTPDFNAVSADMDAVQPATAPDLNDDLVSHPCFKRVNYIINKRVGLVICRSCNVAISPGNEIKHLKEVHKRKLTIQDKVTLGGEFTHHVFGVRSSLAHLNAYLRPTAELLEPLAGLPVILGFQCTLCVERAYCCSTIKSMKEHLRNQHQSANFDTSTRVQSVQRLLSRVPEHCTAYFPVNQLQTGDRELLFL